MFKIKVYLLLNASIMMEKCDSESVRKERLLITCLLLTNPYLFYFIIFFVSTFHVECLYKSLCCYCIVFLLFWFIVAICYLLYLLPSRSWAKKCCANFEMWQKENWRSRFLNEMCLILVSFHHLVIKCAHENTKKCQTCLLALNSSFASSFFFVSKPVDKWKY